MRESVSEELEKVIRSMSFKVTIFLGNFNLHKILNGTTHYR